MKESHQNQQLEGGIQSELIEQTEKYSKYVLESACESVKLYLILFNTCVVFQGVPHLI